MTSARRRRENTAEGCRSLALDDEKRAADIANPRMRASLERSAGAWQARAKLLDRLEASFNARAVEIGIAAEQDNSAKGPNGSLR